jgi:hypothetical protein
MLALTLMPCSAYSDDRSDRLNSESSYTFSPGYINAAKQQMESLKVNIPGEEKKSFLDNAIEYVKEKVGRKTQEQAPANQVANPELQKKSGGVNPAAQTIAANALGQLIDSSQYNVNIGSGTDQVRDASGRLISEVINGRNHVYAGFDNYGTSTIQDAIDNANAGDLIVVRGKDFTGVGKITMKDGVSMYGGYGEDGTRDLSRLTTFDNINTPGQVSATNFQNYTEFSGFRFTTIMCNMIIRNVSNFVLSNNYFRSSISTYSSNILIQNSTFGNSISISGGNVSIISNKFTGLWGIAVSDATVLVRDNDIRGAGWGIATLSGSVTSSNNNFVGGLYANSGNITSTNDYFAGDPIYTTNNANGICSINSVSVAANTLAKAANTKVTINPKSSTTLSAYAFDSNQHSIIESRMWGTGYNLKEEASLAVKSMNNMDPNAVTAILKGLISNKDKFTQGSNIPIDPNLVIKLAQDSLSRSAMAINGPINMQEAELAMALASILNDPNEGQKAVLETITALVTDMGGITQESGLSPGLAKAQNGLLQMLANVLLAQAIPDLLKEGDISNIKNLFSQLDSGKSKILSDYAQSTKPYYDEVKKIVEKNAGAIDIQFDIKKLLQKEAPRSEIDKILEELKNKSKRSSEEDYILQQESKLKEKYIDPNKKKLENDMKEMLSDVTKKLSATLEATKR